MHVIPHPADPIAFTIRPPGDRCQIGVHCGSDRHIKKRGTVFGAKNNVDEEK
jgi:hypothetical protein